MAFSVVVWNMDSWRRKGNPRGWLALSNLGVDVMLLNEATRPANPIQGVRIAGHRRTRGRDYVRPWASLIASRHPMEAVDARVKKVPFQTSRPGAWTAQVISIRNLAGRVERITAVSMYGLLDEMSDASVHRSLSEAAAIFDDRRYNKLILLGGDLNTWTGWDPDTSPRHLARDRSVLQRIEAYGLVDCLKAKRRRGRLADWPLSRSHVQAYPDASRLQSGPVPDGLPVRLPGSCGPAGQLRSAGERGVVLPERSLPGHRTIWRLAAVWLPFSR